MNLTKISLTSLCLVVLEFHSLKFCPSLGRSRALKYISININKKCVLVHQRGEKGVVIFWKLYHSHRPSLMLKRPKQSAHDSETLLWNSKQHRAVDNVLNCGSGNLVKITYIGFSTSTVYIYITHTATVVPIFEELREFLCDSWTVFTHLWWT